jgi:hypothetical protein
MPARRRQLFSLSRGRSARPTADKDRRSRTVPARANARVHNFEIVSGTSGVRIFYPLPSLPGTTPVSTASQTEQISFGHASRTLRRDDGTWASQGQYRRLDACDARRPRQRIAKRGEACAPQLTARCIFMRLRPRQMTILICRRPGGSAGKRIGARRKTSRPSTRSVSIAVRFEAHASLALVPYEDGTSEFSVNEADPPPSARAHGGGAGGLNEPLIDRSSPYCSERRPGVLGWREPMAWG